MPRLYGWLLVGALIGLAYRAGWGGLSSESDNIATTLGGVTGSAVAGAIVAAIAWGIRRLFVREAKGAPVGDGVSGSSDKMDLSRWTTWSWIGLAIAVALVAGYYIKPTKSVEQSFSQDHRATNASLEETLSQAALSIRPNLPKDMGSGVTLFDIEAAGDTLIYKYEWAISVTDMDPGAVFGVKRAVSDYLCGNRDLLKTMDLGARYRADYVDRDGHQIVSVAIDKSMCSR